MTRFLSVVLVGLGLNTALVWCFVYPLAIPPIVAKIAVVPIVLVWNYFGRRLFVFSDRIPLSIARPRTGTPNPIGCRQRFAASRSTPLMTPLRKKRRPRAVSGWVASKFLRFQDSQSGGLGENRSIDAVVGGGMPRAYSSDLRFRLIRAVEDGFSAGAAGRRLGIGELGLSLAAEGQG